MIGTESLTYAPVLGQLLLDRGWMFACAESCTGGLLAAAMTDTPGSSQWFDRGVSVMAAASRPPVQDSAQANIQPRSSSN